jgi:NTE family protein
MPTSSSRTPKKRNGRTRLIDLALQGGGAHGAFSWGVLDRLREEADLEIEGISGTSAGAMNAAVLASGYIAGGAAGAKAALEEFWRRVAWAAQFSPFRRTPLDIMHGRWTLDTSPAFIVYDLTSRMLSAYSLNPPGTNPLRDILAESIDFTQLAAAPIRLFITATNVRTGCGRVFRNAELTRLGLSADAVPGHRNRQRCLLGRRLLRQSDHHAARARLHLERYHLGTGQSGRAVGHAALRARDIRPPQRGFVQAPLRKSCA